MQDKTVRVLDFVSVLSNATRILEKIHVNIDFERGALSFQ